MTETPTEEIFNEMKTIASKIWNTYDNTYGYVNEKLDRINSINNIQDNAMVFYRMFDHENQNAFKYSASPEVLAYIQNNF
jgi:hypothetical protein